MTPSTDIIHRPVMLEEVIASLQPQDGKVYLDGTFGAGGYTKAILSHANCTVYAIDRDPEAIQRAHVLQKSLPHLHIVEGNFADMDQLMASQHPSKVDGIVLDLGVSSPQLDQAERGFSFQKDGPLDMRMEKHGPTAADIVNSYPEHKLAHILWTYGDEKKSRQIAHRIVQERSKKPFTTTLQLSGLVHSVIPKHPSQKIDPATKTFQALRIYINKEIESLKRGLIAAEKILNPGGHLVVVSFHALEDKEVKVFLQSRSGKKSNPSRYSPLPLSSIEHAPTFQLIEKKAIAPRPQEVARNARARSAKLRWALRTPATPWPDEEVA